MRHQVFTNRTDSLEVLACFTKRESVADTALVEFDRAVVFPEADRADVVGLTVERAQLAAGAAPQQFRRALDGLVMTQQRETVLQVRVGDTDEGLSPLGGTGGFGFSRAIASLRVMNRTAP